MYVIINFNQIAAQKRYQMERLKGYFYALDGLINLARSNVLLHKQFCHQIIRCSNFSDLTKESTTIRKYWDSRSVHINQQKPYHHNTQDHIGKWTHSSRPKKSITSFSDELFIHPNSMTEKKIIVQNFLSVNQETSFCTQRKKCFFPFHFIQHSVLTQGSSRIWSPILFTAM